MDIGSCVGRDAVDSTAGGVEHEAAAGEHRRGLALLDGIESMVAMASGGQLGVDDVRLGDKGRPAEQAGRVLARKVALGDGVVLTSASMSIVSR